MHSLSPWTFVESWLGGRLRREVFADVETYALFIGHPRSGTSLTGSLLNAHRQALICNELHVLRYVQRGYVNREQLMWLHYAKDRDFERQGRQWTGYDYRVRDGWQGRFEKLRLIGDKKAARTAEALARGTRPLDRLQEITAARLRLIHVARHPLDVIATVTRKVRKLTLQGAKDAFFERCEVVASIMDQQRHPLHTVWLEQLIAEPLPTIGRLCEFCDLPTESDFLAACAECLLDEPRLSRHQIAWPRGMADDVMRRSEPFAFLQPYVQQGPGLDIESKAA